jgi:hypothetical protein
MHIKDATLELVTYQVQADIDEELHILFEGELVDLLIQVEFQEYVTHHRGKNILYASLNKALYGTVQASLLFWQHLSTFLINSLGFVRNPYDWCVVNKMVNGAQCTVVCYDLKISHESPDVVGEYIGLIRQEFGSKMDLPVRRGKIHEYLGIQIDFTEDQKVKMTMYDYIDELIKESPAELLKGTSATPAANHLFNVNPDCEKLDDVDAALYHHLTAKLLYLSKRTRPDLLLAVSFLSKRVMYPDTDDWKKLGRCLRYLSSTKHLPFVLGANNTGIIRWWVDASSAVHPNMHSHTGTTMSLGTGCPYAISRMQKLNTRSSTEAELVGVNDTMLVILWTRNFLIGQDFSMTNNIIHQYNQSAMLLENNGKMSSSKRTRHLDIRYFFVTDQVHKRNVRIEYCPTDKMITNFFTKPLQGTKFRTFRDLILGCCSDDVPARIKECVATDENSVATNGPIVQTPVVPLPVPETSQSNVLSWMIPADTSWVEVVCG